MRVAAAALLVWAGPSVDLAFGDQPPSEPSGVVSEVPRPLLANRLAATDEPEEIPRPAGGPRYRSKSICELTADICPVRNGGPAGRLPRPEDFSQAPTVFAAEGAIDARRSSYGQGLSYLHYGPLATVAHRPLYFEEPREERYGHVLPLLQPALSAVHFYVSAAALPLKCCLRPPWLRAAPAADAPAPGTDATQEFFPVVPGVPLPGAPSSAEASWPAPAVSQE
jgi:hypothetical protein